MRSLPAALDPDALTVAMAIVPGVYSRNRYFELFAAAEVRRARRRAALLRGLVRELAGAHGPVEDFVLVRCEAAAERDGAQAEPHGGASRAAEPHSGASRQLGRGAELRFRVESMSLTRRVTLTELETSCVAFLAERAGAAHLGLTERDRHLLEDALRRLAPGLRLEGAA